MMTEDCKKAYMEGINKGYADAKAGATLEQAKSNAEAYWKELLKTKR